MVTISPGTGEGPEPVRISVYFKPELVIISDVFLFSFEHPARKSKNEKKNIDFSFNLLIF